MLPSMQVPHQAGPSKGIATARRTSLPPDGLLCNYRWAVSEICIEIEYYSLSLIMYHIHCAVCTCVTASG